MTSDENQQGEEGNQQSPRALDRHRHRRAVVVVVVVLLPLLLATAAMLVILAAIVVDDANGIGDSLFATICSDGFRTKVDRKKDTLAELVATGVGSFITLFMSISAEISPEMDNILIKLLKFLQKMAKIL